MSEDREKHDRAGGRDSVKGFKVGKGASGRQAEARAGMGQYIPDKVRAKVDGTDKGSTE